MVLVDDRRWFRPRHGGVMLRCQVRSGGRGWGKRAGVVVTRASRHGTRTSLKKKKTAEVCGICSTLFFFNLLLYSCSFRSFTGTHGTENKDTQKSTLSLPLNMSLYPPLLAALLLPVSHYYLLFSLLNSAAQGNSQNDPGKYHVQRHSRAEGGTAVALQVGVQEEPDGALFLLQENESETVEGMKEDQWNLHFLLDQGMETFNSILLCSLSIYICLFLCLSFSLSITLSIYLSCMKLHKYNLQNLLLRFISLSVLWEPKALPPLSTVCIIRYED